MPTIRLSTFLFFILLLVLNLPFFFPGSFPWSFPGFHPILVNLLLIAIYFLISFTLAFFPCSNFYHKVICKGRPDGKTISITFDDGPNANKTPLILKILKRHEVLATFFCIGSNIGGNKELLKQVFDEGHIIGNHSYSHARNFGFFTARLVKEELLETDGLIQSVIGKIPGFFRPPYGVINPTISRALKNMHWQVIGWNIRSLDTQNPDPQRTKLKILRQLKPGSIILFHDHTTFVEDHLDELLQSIRDNGYRIVPLDQLLKEPAYVI